MPMLKAHCKFCGSVIENQKRNQKFCNSICRNSFHFGANKKGKVTCPCGSEFLQGRPHQKFCSNYCRIQAHKNSRAQHVIPWALRISWIRADNHPGQPIYFIQKHLPPAGWSRVTTCSRRTPRGTMEIVKRKLRNMSRQQLVALSLYIETQSQ